MARPKLPEGEHRDAHIFARVRPDQKEVFDAGCDLEGISPTALLRQFVLQKNYEWEEKYGKKLTDRIKAKKKMKARSTKE